MRGAAACEASSPGHTPATDTQPFAGLSTKSSKLARKYFEGVVRLGIQAAEALDHAHQQGIVHRDVKPANLMVDDTLRLWVTDFGLAHMQCDGNLTMSGDLVGTLRYMSPEQALAERAVVDHRTDIYSLGATLYELLTLEPALKGRDRQELLRQIAFEEPRRPRHWDRAIPRELETIVLKAMEKNPADRYGTAQEVADDLRNFLHDRPIRARRPTWRHVAGKWLRRHRRLVAAMAVALVAMVLVYALAQRQATAMAEARQAEINAVLEFVENKILAAARPDGYEGGLGRDVKLRQALEAALPFVEKSFADRPLIEARLRMTLGVSFDDLSEPKIAAEQFHVARSLYTRCLGPKHADTLRAMRRLATCYQALGRYGDALKLHTETFALQKATLGPEHPDTLDSMVGLANAYDYLGRYDDALKLREETVALHKATLGLDHPKTLSRMINLAISYRSLGRNEDAIKLSEQTLERQRATIGPEHPDTLTNMTNLALSYSAVGRYKDALNLNEQTLELRKAKLGPYHRKTLLTMSNLANNYRALGRHEDALKLIEETLELRKAKLGIDHADALSSMNNLAREYSHFKRYDDALRLDKQTLDLRKAKLGSDHPETLRSMFNLASDYADLHRYAEARKLWQETLAQQKNRYGLDHVDTLGMIKTLANTYRDHGLHIDRVQLQEQALAEYKDKLGPDNPKTVEIMNWLAWNYTFAGRPADALKIYDEVMQIQHVRFGPEDPKTLESMNAAAWACVVGPETSFCDPQRGIEMAQQVVKLAPKDDRFWNTLGTAYYRAGKFHDAIDTLKKSMDLHKNGGSSYQWFFLGMANWRLGHKEEARKWYEKAVAWAQEHQPQNDNLRRFRAEAAELLGVVPPRENAKK